MGLTGASQNTAVEALVGRALRFLCSQNFIVSERVPVAVHANALGPRDAGGTDAAVASEPSSSVPGFRWRFKATRLGVATLHSAMDCQTVWSHG